MKDLHQQAVLELYRHADQNVDVLNDAAVAHLIVHNNKVLGARLIDGLECDVEELSDGIKAALRVRANHVIAKPVQICFGLLPQKGIQRILMQIVIEKNAAVDIVAHCIFPNAVDIQHIMDANIRLNEGARYSYFEKHVHGQNGGIKVYPKAEVHLAPRSRFKTEFELIKGRVGEIHIDYQAHCDEESTLDMLARINGRGDDVITVREAGHLAGAHARGVLTSKIAVRDQARAEIFNKLTASAPYARGHVDCKEIVQDQGRAAAVPIVEVRHPKAHITHEAAIGSVDNKQLETLMSRGLSEDDAVELIINGLLR